MNRSSSTIVALSLLAVLTGCDPAGQNQWAVSRAPFAQTNDPFRQNQGLVDRNRTQQPGGAAVAGGWGPTGTRVPARGPGGVGVQNPQAPQGPGGQGAGASTIKFDPKRWPVLDDSIAEENVRKYWSSDAKSKDFDTDGIPDDKEEGIGSDPEVPNGAWVVGIEDLPADFDIEEKILLRGGATGDQIVETIKGLVTDRIKNQQGKGLLNMADCERPNGINEVIRSRFAKYALGEIAGNDAVINQDLNTISEQQKMAPETLNLLRKVTVFRGGAGGTCKEIGHNGLPGGLSDIQQKNYLIASWFVYYARAADRGYESAVAFLGSAKDNFKVNKGAMFFLNGEPWINSFEPRVGLSNLPLLGAIANIGNEFYQAIKDLFDPRIEQSKNKLVSLARPQVGLLLFYKKSDKGSGRLLLNRRAGQWTAAGDEDNEGFASIEPADMYLYPPSDDPEVLAYWDKYSIFPLPEPDEFDQSLVAYEEKYPNGAPRGHRRKNKFRKTETGVEGKGSAPASATTTTTSDEPPKNVALRAGHRWVKDARTGMWEQIADGTAAAPAQATAASSPLDSILADIRDVLKDTTVVDSVVAQIGGIKADMIRIDKIKGEATQITDQNARQSQLESANASVSSLSTRATTLISSLDGQLKNFDEALNRFKELKADTDVQSIQAKIQKLNAAIGNLKTLLSSYGVTAVN